jgi:peptidoglycan/LPS O-acetylase OafA/YrhL
VTELQNDKEQKQGSTTVERLTSAGEESGTAPDDRRFRPDVEGLRAVAVLLVVLYHANLPGLSGGFVGVDVFFVISGFVITGLLIRECEATNKISLVHFYARRARRILPASVFVLVVSLIAARIITGRTLAHLQAIDTRWTAVFLNNIHFNATEPGLFYSQPQSPVNHFWSLSIEEQFYVIYPAFFILLILVAIPFLTQKSRMTIGLTALFFVSLALSVALSAPGDLVPFRSLSTRAWEFALGGLATFAVPIFKRIPSVTATVLTWLGITTLLAGAFTLSLADSYPGYLGLIPTLATVAVIAGGTVVPLFGAELFLGSRPFQWIAKRSYSWYLWHATVLVIAAHAAHTAVLQSSLLKNSLLVLGALVLADLTYRFIENPVRHSTALSGHPRLTLVGAGALIASCVALTYAF